MNQTQKRLSTVQMSTLMFGIVCCLTFLSEAAFAGVYYRNSAVSYARRWATSRNPNFPYFASDCTNYVSQAVAVGQQQFEYHGTDPSWHWFYNGRYSYSRSWTVTHDFFNFLRNRGRAYVIGEGVGSNWGAYNSLAPGDLIFASWNDNGWLNHVYIVTGRDWRGILVSAHSNDRLDMPFTDALNQARWNPWRFYYMKMRDQY